MTFTGRHEAALSQQAVSNALDRGAIPATLLLVAAVVPVPSGDGSHLLGLPTLCPFRLLTGYPCPGCGITRALVCAAHGHWRDSLHFHPLGLPALCCLLAVLLWQVFRPRERFPVRAEKALFAAGLVAVLLVWVLRLIGGLPTPP